jgi:hypothetical protein
MLSKFFDVRTRTRTIDTGQFFCPHENAQKTYERKAARLWVSVSFIPVYPLDEQGDYIECQSCQRTYNESVLNPAWHARRKSKLLVIQEDPVSLVNDLKTHLEDGMPVEYAVRNLTKVGFDRSIVMQMIESQIGQERAECHDCGLSYASSVNRCQECDQPTT